MIFLRKDGTAGYTYGDILPPGSIQVDHDGLPVIAGWPGAVTLAAVKPAPITPALGTVPNADLQAAMMRSAASEKARLESLAAAAKDKK